MDLINDNIQWACNQANFILDRWNVEDDREDYHQAAMVGLVEAARKYKGTNDASFRTYAFLRVRGKVIKEMIRNWNIGSLSTNKSLYNSIFTNLPHVVRKMGGTFDKERAAKLLSEELEVYPDPELVADIYSYMGKHVSLNTPLMIDDEKDTIVELVDFIPDEQGTVESAYLTEELKDQLHQAMQNIELDDIDRDIVTARMLAEDPMSQADLGSRFKISQQAVAKRETIIIEKLRKEMNICK